LKLIETGMASLNMHYMHFQIKKNKLILLISLNLWIVSEDFEYRAWSLKCYIVNLEQYEGE